MELRPLIKGEEQLHRKGNISGDKEWNRQEDIKEVEENCRIILFSEIKDEGIGDWAAEAEREEAELEAIKNKKSDDRER